MGDATFQVRARFTTITLSAVPERVRACMIPKVLCFFFTIVSSFIIHSQNMKWNNNNNKSLHLKQQNLKQLYKIFVSSSSTFILRIDLIMYKIPKRSSTHAPFIHYIRTMCDYFRLFPLCSCYFGFLNKAEKAFRQKYCFLLELHKQRLRSEKDTTNDSSTVVVEALPSSGDVLSQNFRFYISCMP